MNSTICKRKKKLVLPFFHYLSLECHYDYRSGILVVQRRGLKFEQMFEASVGVQIATHENFQR